MSERIKAAVVVPAYQAAATLAECLDSLVSQRLPDWLGLEIIVVDDGSSDHTAQVARRYQGQGVRLMRTGRQGAAAARNTGVSAAGPDCRIILFTDSDCLPAPDWAACLVSTLQAAAPGVAGIKGAYGVRQRSAVARFSQLEFEERYNRFRQRQTQPDFADTYSAAYRRELLTAQPFDESLPGAIVEDAELGWRLRQAGYSFQFEPAGIVYHRHPENIGKYFRRKFRIAHWRVSIYRRYPGQLPADSHTSQGAKGQMVLLAAILLNLGLWSASRIPRLLKRPAIKAGHWFGLAGLAGLTGLQLSFGPFIGRARQAGGLKLALTSWLMLNLRVAAYSLGAGLGLAELFWRKRQKNEKETRTGQ
ncbi:MAG: putative glycosyltransferase [Chloroflexi bacterium]|jgi:glycosyltransferase involved in cell wall biosynthesis|nr:putative glycosyltransferase [Chloroflexota bacterium]